MCKILDPVSSAINTDNQNTQKLGDGCRGLHHGPSPSEADIGGTFEASLREKVGWMDGREEENEIQGEEQEYKNDAMGIKIN